MATDDRVKTAAIHRATCLVCRVVSKLEGEPRDTHSFTCNACGHIHSPLTKHWRSVEDDLRAWGEHYNEEVRRG